MKFKVCQCPYIAETSISDNEIDFINQLSDSNAPKGPAINSDLTFDSYFIFDEIKNLFGISLDILWSDFAFCATVSPIIPNQNVAFFVQEILKIERMRVIDHMLVAQSIGIAKNKRVKTFILWLRYFWRGKRTNLWRLNCLLINIPT